MNGLPESTMPTGPAPRPPSTGAPVDPEAVLARLEQIRQGFHHGLDRIESLARQRLSGLARAEPADFLSESRHELDQLRARLQTETDHWEQQRQALIEEIEHDRLLLAEAWERLERAQVEAAATSRAPPRTSTISKATTAPTVSAPRVASASSNEDSAVSQAILRQFEMLRRDVRRNGGGHVHA
ncbi:hypothetical protein BH23PLA1_BH23PLA1_15970 [soil metagenome]